MGISRREFIKTVGIAAAGSIAAPYILPTGRLFASSGSRIANHVVFVLFAGGLRNQETIEMQYLAAQGQSATGNLMPNMLKGAEPNSHLLYNKWTPILSTPLSQQGTLFQEVQYKTGPTGHFNGHTVAMTGNYTETGLDLTINPQYPTVFEYYRKHYSPAQGALNAWWITETLGPYTALNYSRDPEYGPIYGANYLSPATTFFQLGGKYFNNMSYLPPDDVVKISQIRNFLDANYSHTAQQVSAMQNTPDDRAKVEDFIKATTLKTYSNQIEWPLPMGITPNELTIDLVNLAFGWEVLKGFHPELMVINTISSDICHTDFSSYLSFMHKADYGVGWLWNKIQSDPVLKDDTIMICMPEHGRNLQPNGLYDANGFRAFDHTSDYNSRRIFAMVVGPASKVKQGQVIGSQGNPVGESIDIVPTIAHILGFDTNIPAGKLPGRVLTEAFA
jgi:hypothetical protein